MKILHLLQQSVVTQARGPKMWMSSDSAIQMFVGITKEILHKTDWKIDCVVGFPFYDIGSMKELLHHERLTYYHASFVVDAMMARYDFDTTFWSQMLDKTEPDIIWCDVPELVRNFKALLQWMGKTHIKLICCNYFLDLSFVPKEDPIISKDIGYAFRQLDGALSADLVPFTCKSTREIFIDQAKQIIPSTNPEIVLSLLKKSKIWDFGFSYAELSQYKNDGYTFAPSLATFVFPNRMTGNNYTHHEEMISAVNALWLERRDFQVIVTNPNNKMKWDELSALIHPLAIIKNSPLTREEYVKLLWGADFSFSLFERERYGGCSNTEAIFCRCFPIMPKIYEYARRAPSDYPLFIQGLVTQEAIMDKMRYAIEHKKEIQGRYGTIMPSYVLDHSSYESVSTVVIRNILGLYE